MLSLNKEAIESRIEQVKLLFNTNMKLKKFNKILYIFFSLRVNWVVTDSIIK